MSDTVMNNTVIRDFHRLYYEHGVHGDYGRGLHAQTKYHGVESHKCPLDLWIYQELLYEVRPALVIELGTYLGGTSLFLAHQLELLQAGSVVSIDCRSLPRPEHPRLRYLLGETTAPEVLAEVRAAATHVGSQPVMVIHDADHRRDQVLADLECYAPLVTPGSYLIVEDTNVNGHPVLNGWGPGPWEAVDEFLEHHSDFAVDPTREKFLMTYNPRGYLRRLRAGEQR